MIRLTQLSGFELCKQGVAGRGVNLRHQQMILQQPCPNITNHLTDRPIVAILEEIVYANVFLMELGPFGYGHYP